VQKQLVGHHLPLSFFFRNLSISGPISRNTNLNRRCCDGIRSAIEKPAGSHGIGFQQQSPIFVDEDYVKSAQTSASNYTVGVFLFRSPIDCFSPQIAPETPHNKKITANRAVTNILAEPEFLILPPSRLRLVIMPPPGDKRGIRSSKVSQTTWAGIPPDEDTYSNQLPLIRVNRAVIIDFMDETSSVTTAHALAKIVRVAGCAVPVR
jgi:hypothetical protein